MTSIKNFMTPLYAHSLSWKTNHMLLGVYFALYDALIDDEEDVRDQASAVVSSLLSDSSVPGNSGKSISLSLSPLAANLRLLQFIVLEYETQPPLWAEVVNRTTGAYLPATISPSEAPALQLHPAKASLKEAMRPDNALFAEEKQNLFVDDVKEAELWARALQDIYPTIDLRTKQTLENWTFAGISALASTAQGQIDGPLGWTSKPEVFTLGMRVILTAKVVLRDPSVVVGGPSPAGKQCREALTSFLTVGMETLVHELWLRGIRQALG